MLEFLIEQIAKERGIDEKLKAQNQLRWIQEMNACRLDAEEIVLREIIYR